MNKKLDMKQMISYAMDFCRDEPAVSFLLRRIRSYDVHLYIQAVRSAYFSMELAKGLHMTDAEQAIVYRSALLQDVGKLQHDNTNFLNHPLLSVELLQPMIENGLIDRDAILEHHENLDGTGYPKGLNWEKISLTGRILRVADSFASMIKFDRSNGEVNDVGQAMEELYRWGDMMYDTDLVDLIAFYYSPLTVQANKKGAISYL
ncbi:HD domain-containing protein [Paenibacillus psychroresistens]|uniref:HD domain-containing protein n=1 Tax=Paenibacillus psychroresistens TaxID=1778678 RepID=A0A6B8RTW0_9BACL|nr:HD domain-containing phosphohydrolase [Paenibacillus psychroresistens]QGQ98618.1 HD domain-containing protein [Paenibacillus psychroresistens]